MNAIIMAAGTGIRLRPWTNDRPKGLVEIEGIPIIERQIRFFRERGVDEIIIVAGHQARRFDSLIARDSDITLVFNDKYDVYNNIYSMYLVRDRLDDGYVSEADVFMHENYVLPHPDRSLIFGGYRKGFAKEWIVRFDESRRIRRIDVQGGEGIIQAGLSYWTGRDAPLLRDKLEEMIGARRFRREVLGRRFHVPLRPDRCFPPRDRSRGLDGNRLPLRPRRSPAAGAPWPLSIPPP